MYWRTLLLWLLWLSLTLTAYASRLASGVVFHDLNRNGVRDVGEPGIAGVLVSNQREVVRTDSKGRYQLPVGDDTILFVIKPRGWQVYLSEYNLPQFFYIHKPNGSPKLRFPGVEPTGELPQSVDFALYPQREPRRFSAIIFGDTQPRDVKEVGYIARHIVRELVGTKEASFLTVLGDVVFDDLTVFEPLNRVLAQIGVPVHPVLGNHDMNFDSPDDRYSDETWERTYGPPYYAFEWGRVSFIVLDDVIWYGARDGSSGRYEAGLGEQQLTFIRNYLNLVPKDNLVVLLMHIPLWQLPEAERTELFTLLAPFSNTLSFSAHTHIQTHRFFGAPEGWKGRNPHHHVNAGTASGSWWRGVPDPIGIPHATMGDGTPNGYLLATFEGNRYTIRYKTARRPADYQMHIYVPDIVPMREVAQTRVLVNVFFGSERSSVEMRIGEKGNWIPMTRVTEPDPAFAEMKKLEEQYTLPGLRLPGVSNCTHLWAAQLPPDTPRGTYVIHVRTTDMFGQVYFDRSIMTIR